MGETWQTIGTGTEEDRSADGRRARTSSSSACSLRAMGGCAGRTRSAAASCSWSRFCSRRSSRSSSRLLPSRAARSCSPPATSRTSVRWRSARTPSSTPTTTACSASCRRRRTGNRCRSARSRRCCRRPRSRSKTRVSGSTARSTTAASPAPSTRTWRTARSCRAARRSRRSWYATSTSATRSGRLSRKIKEACLSDKLFQREQHQYGKNARKRILSDYLNEVFYGRHAYGAEAAARTYFSKDAADLTLVQAALLAGLPQAPTVFDPITNPHAALVRRNEVLQAMWKNGYISAAKLRSATEKKLGAQARAPLLAAERAELLRLGDDAAVRAGSTRDRSSSAASRRRRRSTRACRVSPCTPRARSCSSRRTRRPRSSRSTPRPGP